MGARAGLSQTHRADNLDDELLLAEPAHERVGVLRRPAPHARVEALHGAVNLLPGVLRLLLVERELQRRKLVLDRHGSLAGHLVRHGGRHGERLLGSAGR